MLTTLSESLFIEIKSKSKNKLLIGCTYLGIKFLADGGMYPFPNPPSCESLKLYARRTSEEEGVIDAVSEEGTHGQGGRSILGE